MSVFVVTWDLNKQRANYNQARQTLINYLSRYTHIKDPGLDSVWFIDANTTAAQLSSSIQTYLHESDRLFVVALHKGHCEGWLAAPITNWLNARL